jgi:hypothetical protein
MPEQRKSTVGCIAAFLPFTGRTESLLFGLWDVYLKGNNTLT